MDLKAILGANVRRLRKDRQLSQEDFAFRVKQSQSYVSRLEAGEINATLDTIAEIAGVLEVDPPRLLEPHKPS